MRLLQPLVQRGAAGDKELDTIDQVRGLFMKGFQWGYAGASDT